VVWSKQEPDF